MFARRVKFFLISLLSVLGFILHQPVLASICWGAEADKGSCQNYQPKLKSICDAVGGMNETRYQSSCSDEVTGQNYIQCLELCNSDDSRLEQPCKDLGGTTFSATDYIADGSGCSMLGTLVHSTVEGTPTTPTPPTQQPPQATFSVSPSEGVPPLTVTLDASGSTDSDGSIASYQWVTSDGKTTTGSTASFIFDKAGVYNITLTVTDNSGLTNTTMRSVKVSESKFGVMSVTSKYPENTHFLDGLDHEVSYKAEIDWGGGQPGTVSFITPTGTKDVAATGNTVEQTFNMGKDFGTCGKLKVVATSKNGVKSPEKEANFVIMSSPFSVNFIRVGGVGIGVGGNSFSYSRVTGGVHFKVIDYLAKRTDDKVPIFGKNPLGLRFIPSVVLNITSEGETKVKMDWQGAKQTLIKLGDFKAELQPTVNIKGKFKECRWQWGGDIGVSGKGGFELVEPLVWVGPIPIPIVYLKAVLSLGVSGALAVEQIDPATFEPQWKGGKIGLSPSGKGSLGIGLNDIVALEGWLQAGGEWTWLIPPTQLDKPTTAKIADKIGATIVALSWKWEGEALSCEWDFVKDAGKCTSPFIRSALRQPILLERDYLNNPDHGRFTRSTRGLRDSATDSMTLQAAVYPYSDVNLSGNDKTLYAVWVVDNSKRSSINRTQIVFTTWNGSEWTELQPIADDGTADFHPNVLAFTDNQVVATWEDTKQVLTDAAKFEDSISNLEISVGNYNPQTQQWTTQRLTDNSYLDRSPKLSGTNGNAIVTWISRHYVKTVKQKK